MNKTTRYARFTHMHSGGRAAGILAPESDPPKYIYADSAIPGEEAEVALLRRRFGFRQAEVVQLLNASSDRVEPFCPHAQVCGGCNWQHLSYPSQLYWKRQILVNALAKYNIDTPPVPEVVPSPLQQGYRNKSEYSFSALSRQHDGRIVDSPAFGFHPKEDSVNTFPCTNCFLQPSHVHALAEQVFALSLEKQLPLYHYPSRDGLLRTLMVRTSTLDETLCIAGFSCKHPAQEDQERIHSFLTHMQQTIPGVHSWFYHISDPQEEKRPFYPAFTHFGGARFLRERIDHLTFKVSPEAFFQPNPLQTVALYRQIKAYARLTGAETVYDLYTGIGSIACYIAGGAKQVIGIEGNPAAIEDARENARFNGITNTHFITGDILETFTPEFIRSHPKADLVILDPPRSGTLTEIKKALLCMAPKQIIYVSCNPVSLAWDLKQLCAGGYRVAALQPFDMFPHTHHIETVSLLEHEA